MTGIFIASEENQKPGPARSCELETRPDIPDSGQIRDTAARTKTAPLPAVRATALRGQGITRPREPKSTSRRLTQQELYRKDPEIPYVKFEATFRDLVCSLMERQDRMNEEIFLKLNDLGYRVEDIEQDRQEDGGGR